MDFGSPFDLTDDAFGLVECSVAQCCGEAQIRKYVGLRFVQGTRRT